MSHHYDKLIGEHIRISLLIALLKGGGYSHNESVLQGALAEYGLVASRDRIRTELRWLEEQGLVTIKDVSGYLVATLTARGADAAEGRATIPGVKRPGPKD
jgi:DNA-binding GntR family transcriptional regulator